MVKVKNIVMLLSFCGLVNSSFCVSRSTFRNSSPRKELNKTQKDFLLSVNFYIDELNKQLDDVNDLIAIIQQEEHELALLLGHLMFLKSRLDDLKVIQTQLKNYCKEIILQVDNQFALNP